MLSNSQHLTIKILHSSGNENCQTLAAIYSQILPVKHSLKYCSEFNTNLHLVLLPLCCIMTDSLKQNIQFTCAQIGSSEIKHNYLLVILSE